uniref:Uncharacterized protein n=1 Tax=viral metagenome TaxID=1070528 RepID=A0A6C0C0X4_9ZZZZ
MDTQEVTTINSVSEKKSFINHLFDGTPEGNAEYMNAIQYALIGIIPIVGLNKIVQNFIPDVDLDKSTLEIIVEIMLQIVIMFAGIILVHRAITYFPTYSGFKYDNFILTNVILAFLVLILSIQTKVGMKVNIMYERIMEMYNGPRENMEQNENTQQNVQVNVPPQVQTQHNENLHFSPPPAPVVTQSQQAPQVPELGGGLGGGPMAANSVIGGAFGSSF